MSQKIVEFHFDFASPTTYLAIPKCSELRMKKVQA